MGIKTTETQYNITEHPQKQKILTPEAIEFLIKLHKKFNIRREELLILRHARQKRIDAGEEPDFLSETKEIRDDPSWSVLPPPKDLLKRHVEITGPTDRKMVINALNSGADIFMADFEDANSPTWGNLIEGQLNLIDAVSGAISFTNPDGKKYTLNETHATLVVRPRGWHLVEKHFLIDGEPISGSLFDFGLYFFHNANALIEKGTGPYFYLPKLESHLEARLWNDVFSYAQEQFDISLGTIKATVLIETILAAFEMEEILYELREHSVGLNAGRWDYMFSIIKKFNHRNNFLFPDRSEIIMTVPFMRAYTTLLVKTCHKRKAHAIGGMAAFIPNRKEPKITEIAIQKVREDKTRESTDGFDGTWVAHPDLVSIAKEEFVKVLGSRQHQVDKAISDLSVESRHLLNFAITNGKITEQGVRHNINVGIQYLIYWLNGVGAASIDNLMEDAATAEICRAQIWQWLHHGGRTDTGIMISAEYVRRVVREEMIKIQALLGKYFPKKSFEDAEILFITISENQKFIEFLTTFAYDKLD